MRDRTDQRSLVGSLDDDYGDYNDHYPRDQVYDHGATAAAPPRSPRSQLVHDLLARAGRDTVRWLACLTLGLFALLIGRRYGLDNRPGGIGVAAMLVGSLGVFIWQGRSTAAEPITGPVRRASDRKGRGRRG